jgi:hypothetical protein
LYCIDICTDGVKAMVQMVGKISDVVSGFKGLITNRQALAIKNANTS